jgi:hypothetical protein
MLIFQRPWARQPPTSKVTRALAPAIQLALSGAGPDLAKNSGGKVVTPFGVGLNSSDDNAFQFPRTLGIQNADTVTVQALVYSPAAPVGSEPTRVFGTRGTTAGDGNRRGWEVGIDGGSSVDGYIQVFDSSGTRTSNAAVGAISGADATAKLLWVTFQVVRVPSTSTTLDVWLRLQGSPETTANCALGAFGDDTPLANFPEVCGTFAGYTPNASFSVLQLIVRAGTISASERAQWYLNPWRDFAPLPTRYWAAAAGGDVTTALTGVTGTGSLGTVTPAISTALTGTSATGSLGTVTPGTSRALTSNTGTGSVGTVTPGSSVALTATTGTGSLGTVTPSISVALTGVAGTGTVGTVTADGDVTAALTGVTGTGSLGTVAPASSVALTGTTGTGSVGSVSPATSAALTGVTGTGSVGTVEPSITVALTGVTGTGSVGTVSASGGASGGDYIVIGGVYILIGGDNVTLGEPDDGIVALTGVTGTGSTGTVSPAITIELTGVTGTGSVGTVTASVDGGTTTIELTGVSATGSVGTLVPDGADPAPEEEATPTRGIPGPLKKGRKRPIWVGNRLMELVDGEAPEPIPAKEAKKIKAPRLEDIKAIAAKIGQEKAIAEMYRRQEYEAMLAAYEAMQEEDDINSILALL